MPLDVTGELESYLPPDIGRLDSPQTSDPVSPACLKPSSTTLLSLIEEKSAGLGGSGASEGNCDGVFSAYSFLL